MLYFVENLTLRVWLFDVLPKLRKQLKDSGPVSCWYIDASRMGLSVAMRYLTQLPGVTLEELKFRLIDVRDESGLLQRLKVHFQDLQTVENDLVTNHEFRIFSERAGEGRLRSFALKEAMKFSILGKQTLSRGLMLTQICAWSMGQKEQRRALLFTEVRPWFSNLERYAERVGVSVIPVRPPKTIPKRLTELFAKLEQGLSPRFFFFLQALRNQVLHWRFASSRARSANPKNVDPVARIAIEYKGYFNVDRPECYSDIFFWQASNLPGTAMLVTFSLPADPVDESRLAELAKHGIRAIALHSGATTSSRVPLFTFWPSIKDSRMRPVGGTPKTRESKWINKQVALYQSHRDYWTKLFRQENVKLCVSWYRYDGTHCAIGDAVRNVGGISAIYQRALQVDSTPDTRIDADVAFGYSPFDAGVERRSGSIINFHVATGYLGDHRLPLLTKQANDLKLKLKEQGARFIIAFFDEYAGPDERWNSGETLQRENYQFVFDKVLSDPTLGLVLKPKVPRTLKKRLGPVADQLQRALASGRCYWYQDGTIQGVYPPAAAALAADVAIHGHACTATAGFEAALAGVPTVMLDLEGWHASPIYELGPHVIFQSREALWKATLDYRKNPRRYTGFGCWSPMLEKLDPFRDGRGAYRMGEYLKWLLDDLRAGRNRATAMADAAERYCRMWGHDKVAEININSRDRKNEMHGGIDEGMRIGQWKS